MLGPPTTTCPYRPRLLLHPLHRIGATVSVHPLAAPAMPRSTPRHARPRNSSPCYGVGQLLRPPPDHLSSPPSFPDDPSAPHWRYGVRSPSAHGRPRSPTPAHARPRNGSPCCGVCPLFVPPPPTPTPSFARPRLPLRPLNRIGALASADSPDSPPTAAHARPRPPTPAHARPRNGSPGYGVGTPLGLPLPPLLPPRLLQRPCTSSAQWRLPTLRPRPPSTSSQVIWLSGTRAFTICSLLITGAHSQPVWEKSRKY